MFWTNKHNLILNEFSKKKNPPKWLEAKIELLPFNFSLILLQAILISEKWIETVLTVWLVSSVIIKLQ